MLSEARRPLLGRVALAALATGAALSLSGCGLPLLPPALTGGSDEPTESYDAEAAEEAEYDEETETEEPVGAEDQDVNALAVGDCLNEMEVEYDDSVSTAPIVDCSESHDLEVYHGGFLDSGLDYPGRDEVIEMVDENCYGAFQTFVGTAYEESVLDIQTLFPMEEGWELGDREYLCLIGQMDGSQTTGTLAQTNL
ncbi:septum formation family protein [Nocardiopsis sp. L17-MgMaSL7]|uniref:septum formation family protein n=1 Tax=Nocardiopsis sp. L17-MgMaSL7 TaxID=1938893 RepID=UPI000D714A9E|nr:septum formation family protein [Nocardiopsis sp. L17-MgMaSL7]PWV58220.1 putative regulator of septum formation [Nocardiopsis sp. L17-MgMaSL7]